jgi:enolase
MYRAAVPSGASTGIHEAVELRDGDKKRFNGKGVLKAVASVNDVFSAKLKGMDVTGQGKLDAAMIDLDGTPNKGKLGANAILAVSMAVAKAGAAAHKLPLYQYIAHLAGKPTSSACILPVPSFNVINGGEHAGNGLAFQEFMILPTGAQSFSEAMRMGCETYAALKTVLKKKYGQDSVNVGDEGGFAPNISDAEEGLNLLSTAIEAAGYTGRMVIGMDVAASEFIVEGTAPNSKYDVLKKKTPGGPGVKNGAEMLAMYQDFAKKYPIVSIEDPFEQVSGGGGAGGVATADAGAHAVTIRSLLLPLLCAFFSHVINSPPFLLPPPTLFLLIP